ncbi:MAG: DUF2817 domain-containing protein [Planctomycetales bacterium]|nr:DUF2817 domain-containing protein [Planctomycetales bacterium]
MLSGCQPARDPYAPTILTPVLGNTEILGVSAQNRPIRMTTIGSGPDVVLIMATIHGNEDAGTPLVQQLMQTLRHRPDLSQTHTIMIIPVTNPDGYALQTRGNARGIDLNRNFPASNRIDSDVFGQAGLTEPESRILHDMILAHQPARIVTIHQPLYCLDYDGPAESIALAMSYYCPLPVKKLGSRPGSLGSFAGVEQNIPIITMELAKEDSQMTDTQLWTTYGPALLAAITYPQSPF